MARYTTKTPRAWIGVTEEGVELASNAEPMLPGQVVIEEEYSPSWTGLIDVHGNRIYRLPERRRIGFITKDLDDED
jgi:hypothetical protein